MSLCCRKFELIPTSIFQGYSHFKKTPKFRKIFKAIAHAFFPKNGQKNHNFVLHFLIHINVLAYAM